MMSPRSNDKDDDTQEEVSRRFQVIEQSVHKIVDAIEIEDNISSAKSDNSQPPKSK